MNDQYPKQEEAIRKLEKQGFRFAKWSYSNDVSTGEEIASATLIKKTRSYSTEYRFVEPDGSIN